MERLTKRNLHDFAIPTQGTDAFHLLQTVDRLAAIEDILGNDYDLDRLRELLEACKGLEPSEIAESKLLIATRKDPEKLARMAELVQADREGRCSISPKLICIDEVTTPTPEQYRWMMGRFLKGEQDG